MLLHFLERGQAERFRHIQADEFRLETLVFHPFLDHGLVPHNFDARFIHLERHPGKTLGMELVELVLVIVMIRRPKNHTAQTALGDKRVNSLGRVRGRALGGVKSRKMIFEHVRHGLIFAEPGRVIQRAGKQRLFGRAIGILFHR